MGAYSLLQKTQKDFVNSDTLGVSQEIVYVHADSLAGNETVMAFVEVVTIRGNSTTDRLDEVVFSNVLLSEAPKRTKDYIIFNGEELIVDNWALDGELYRVETLSNISQKNRRR